MEHVFSTPAGKGKSKYLYAAKSFFADRFTPAVETVLLPEFEHARGTVTAKFVPDHVSSARDTSAKKKFSQSFKSTKKSFQIIDEIVIDLRRNSPHNWSHSLNSHLPYTRYLMHVFAETTGNRDVVCLLPKDTPKHIKKLYSLFDIRFFLTDADVKADCIDYLIDPFICLRSVARLWVEQYLSPLPGYQRIKADKKYLGEEFFISRKDTRRASNEAEIASYLEKDHGMKKVYAEDLSPEDQISIFMHASKIVAIHGAAIGPLIYRPLDAAPLKMIEIFSPGHVTNVFRGSADKINADWVGVRGRIEAHQVSHAYDFKNAFLKYSLSDFHIDLDSLKAAMSHLDSGLV